VRGEDGPTAVGRVSTRTLRTVALALDSFMNADGCCWPSVETIAATAGVSVRQTQRAIRALEAQGFLRIDGASGRGRVSRYYETFPPTRKGDIKGDSRSPFASDPARERVTPRALKGDPWCHREVTPDVTQTINEQQEEQRASRAAAPRASDVSTASAVTLSSPSRNGQRAAIFSSLALSFGVDVDAMSPAQHTEWSGYAKALDEAHAAPEDVPGAVLAFIDLWPQAKPTPRAIVKHWPQLLGHVRQRDLSGRSAIEVQVYLAARDVFGGER
jgi:hypothetical protein